MVQESYNFNNNAYRRFVETLKVRLEKKREKRAVHGGILDSFNSYCANIPALTCMCVCDHTGFHRPKWHSIARKIRHLAEGISRITSTTARKLNEHFAGTKICRSPWAHSNAPKEKKTLPPIKNLSPSPFNLLVLSGCRTFRLTQDSYIATLMQHRMKGRKRRRKKSSPRCH